MRFQGSFVQSAVVSGFLRGEEYIKSRNLLVDALRVTTTDDEPGYISLPLWGRFPVIVIDWDIEETAKELGQCKVNITFTRAGCPLAERWQGDNAIGKSVLEAAEDVKIAAANSYVSRLAGSVNEKTLVKSFQLFRKKLFETAGRIQGGYRKLNELSNSVARISNLIAQGIRSPKTLALALFGIMGKIATSLAEIKNAGEETAGGEECSFTDATTPPPARDFANAKLATSGACSQYSLQRMYPLSPATSFACKTRADCWNRKCSQIPFMQSATELSITLNAGMPLLTLAHYLGAEETVLLFYRRFFCGKGGNSLCLKSLSMLFRQVRKTRGRRVRSFINIMELRPLQVCLQQTCGKRDFWKTGMPRRTKYHNWFCASKSGADCKTNIRFQTPSVQSANAPPPATS